MTAKTLIRLATGFIIFFAAGHSIGHFTRHETDDPKAQEVLRIMQENQFDLYGSLRSYDDNYEGMSLNLIFTLVSISFILWIISSYTETNQVIVLKIIYPITILLITFSLTSFFYFFIVPALTCVVAGILLLLAIIKIKK